MKLIPFVIVFFAAASLFAFPMKGLEQHSELKMSHFKFDGSYKPEADKSPYKLMCVWNSEKRISKKQHDSFIEFCKTSKYTCISVDQLGKDHTDENVHAAVDKDGYIDTWGIVALPMTIILDSKNKIVDAVGYEGQYQHIMSEIVSKLK